MSQLNLLSQINGGSSLSTDIFEYLPGFIAKEESSMLLEKLISSTSWEHRRIKMYGKEMLTPRLTAWFGKGADYPEREKPASHPWTPELLEIKSRVEALANTEFDAVLLNYYRDGNDSVAWHDDEDKTPGKNMTVASVSLGQERMFDIRSKADHKKKLSILLEDGSYLLMKGTFQSHYEHRVAKSTKTMGPRINLTFRKLIP